MGDPTDKTDGDNELVAVDSMQEAVMAELETEDEETRWDRYLSIYREGRGIPEEMSLAEAVPLDQALVLLFLVRNPTIVEGNRWFSATGDENLTTEESLMSLFDNYDLKGGPLVTIGERQERLFEPIPNKDLEELFLLALELRRRGFSRSQIIQIEERVVQGYNNENPGEWGSGNLSPSRIRRFHLTVTMNMFNAFFEEAEHTALESQRYIADLITRYLCTEDEDRPTDLVKFDEYLAQNVMVQLAANQILKADASTLYTLLDNSIQHRDEMVSTAQSLWENRPKEIE